MKTSIEIANLTGKKINPDFLKKIIRETVKQSKMSLNRFELSVVFVSEKEIKKINRKYRRKNKSTDVLSFRYDLGYNKKGESLEGELVLCPEIIAKNARENNVSFLKELAFVLAHGTLHILSWKHGKEMYELQDKITSGY